MAEYDDASTAILDAIKRVAEGIDPNTQAGGYVAEMGRAVNELAEARAWLRSTAHSTTK